jgi:uncharacterized membrane protein YfcA
MYYLEFFLITLVVSTFFAMGGVGSAVALVPIFNFLGINFLVAKTVALFINTSTTVTATFMNFKRGVLDVKFALPLVVSSLIFAPVGAYSSKFINTLYVKYGFVAFLIFSATMMLIPKRKSFDFSSKRWILYLVGGVVGFVSGILGIGGGSLVMPLMILLGFDAKKMAIAVSFMVPFSTFSAFLSYISFVKVDWLLIFSTAVGAIIGGYLGNRIMHFRLDSKDIKRVIAILLYLIAIKMVYSLV